MDIGLLFRLPLSTRGYLIYQALGSVLVNLVINFGFAWPMRHHSSIALFGWSGSVAFDVCSTAFLLSGLTVLSGSCSSSATCSVASCARSGQRMIESFMRWHVRPGCAH